MPPSDGSTYRLTGRRGFVGDPFWQPQTVMHLEQSLGAMGHTRQHQNAWFVGEDAFELVHRGWVPTPYANPQLTAPGTELVFTVDTVTPLDAGSFVEFRCSVTDPNGPVDVSSWLTPGMKLRWGASGYGVVCVVNVDKVWVVGPIGTAAPAVTAVLAPLSVSSAAEPFGWPRGLAAWELIAQTAIDGSGYAAGNSLTVDCSASGGGTVVNGNRWKSPSAVLSLHLPGGPFDFTWDCFVDGQRTTVGGLNLIGGLSQGGNNQPPGDLDDRVFLGGWAANTPFRTVLRGRARRDLLNTGDVHNWPLSLTDGGTTSGGGPNGTSFNLRADAKPTTLKARFRYNDY